MWLGEVFTELGFQAFPALHCRQALTLAKRLERPINALVVNPELPGATRAVKTLLAANPGARVMWIRNAAAHDPGDRHPTLERPSPWDPISRPEWVAKVRKILVND